MDRQSTSLPRRAVCVGHSCVRRDTPPAATEGLQPGNQDGITRLAMLSIYDPVLLVA